MASEDVSRVDATINLTTLAPDIVATILDETLPENVVLSDLAIDTPLSWEEQRKRVLEAANKVRVGIKSPTEKQLIPVLQCVL